MAKVTQYARSGERTLLGYTGYTFSVPYQEDFTVIGVPTFSWTDTDLGLSEIGVNEDDEFASIRIGPDILNIGLFTNFVPSSTADTRGYTGQLSYDTGFIYIKTSAGWKKATLNTF